MGYFFDAFRALSTTFRTMFRPPQTVEFPDVIRPRAERYRASFALTDDEHGEISCVACMACEKICPSQVIKVKSGGKRESPVTGKKRAYPDDFVLDLSACIQCELCVQVCNSDSIVMVREPEVPAYSREDLVLPLERLRANANKKTNAWANGTKLQEMQEGKKAEKPAAEKKPASAKPAAKAEAPAEANADAKADVTNGDVEAKAEAKPVVEAKPVPTSDVKADGDAKKTDSVRAPAGDDAKPSTKVAQAAPVLEGRTP